MGPALAAVDVVVSRAGAIALSEFCSLGKACVLVPSPNVAENHQKKNAQALSKNDAAILVEEKNIDTELFESINLLVKDVDMQKKLGVNCKKMDKPKAAERIVDIIEELIHD